MSYEPRNLLKSDLQRGGRLAVICLVISIAWVPTIAALAAPVPLGELAATAAIPLIFSYVLIRLIMRFASSPEELTHEQRERFEKESPLSSKKMSIVVVIRTLLLAFVFVAGIWIIAVASLSYAAYLALGIAWAARGARETIRITTAIVAITAILICLATLCREWMIKIARLAHEALNHPIGHRGAAQH